MSVDGAARRRSEDGDVFGGSRFEQRLVGSESVLDCGRVGVFGRHAVVDADDLVALKPRHQNAFADPGDAVPENVAASVDVENHLAGLVFGEVFRRKRVDAHASERFFLHVDAVFLRKRQRGGPRAFSVVLGEGAHGLGGLFFCEPEFGRGRGDALSHFGAHGRGGGKAGAGFGGRKGRLSARKRETESQR